MVAVPYSWMARWLLPAWSTAPSATVSPPQLAAELTFPTGRSTCSTAPCAITLAEAAVERYNGVFWKKASSQLADWVKIIEKIEKGEKKIARNREIREALETKVRVTLETKGVRGEGHSPPTVRTFDHI